MSDSFSKTRGKPTKNILGLRKYCYTSPLLKALAIPHVLSTLGLQALELLKTCASKFYCYLYTRRDAHTNGTPLDRAGSYASSSNVHVLQYVLNKAYCNSCQRRLKAKTPIGVDGVIDSVRLLLPRYDNNKRIMLDSLLKY